MGMGIKEVSEDEHQVFDNWLRPSQSPKLYQCNKRPHEQQQLQPLNCPRCDSINTKFCYYNNYNKTQPRHFCKSCKRHWTNGGTLRNVPVGGGRKNKRRKPSPSTTTATTSQFSSSYQTMNIHHQPLFLNNDINNSSLMYNTESFINLLPGHDHHNYDLQFSFSSSNFEANPSSNDITNSFKKVENMEESEVGGIDTSSLSSGMELGSSSYWNWNEFDTTVLVPDLTIPNWDIETEINP